MHASRILRQATLALSLPFAWAAAQAAPSYQLLDLGAVYADGANSSGAAVGNYITEGGSTGQGFIFSPKTGYTNFGEPGENIQAINDAGQILTSKGLYTNGALSPFIGGEGASVAYRLNQLGQYTGDMTFAPNEASRPFLYNGHDFIDLGSLHGSDRGFGQGLNNLGQVTGASTAAFDANGEGVFHAFVYANGQMKDLGTLPGDESSIGYGINDAGTAVGQSGQRAYLYQNGQMTNLSSLTGAEFGASYDINNSGQAVGSGWGVMPQFAFVYREGQAFNLNTLLSTEDKARWDLVQAFSINEQGVIAGYGYIDGEFHTYLATPSAVPESNSGVMLALGLLMLGGRFVLRKNAATQA